MIRKLYYNQKIRYLFVGGLNTVIAYGIFFGLLYSGINYSLALCIGYGTALVNGYLWNKYFVFNSQKKSISEVLRFFLVYVIQYIFCLVLLWVFIDGFGMNKYFAGIISIIMSVIVTFLGHKNFTYKERDYGKKSI